MNKNIKKIFAMKESRLKRNKLIKRISLALTGGLLLLAIVLCFVFKFYNSEDIVLVLFMFLIPPVIGIATWSVFSQRDYKLERSINREVVKTFADIGLKKYYINRGFSVLDIIPTRMISISNSVIYSDNLIVGNYKLLDYRMANMEFEYNNIDQKEHKSFSGRWMVVKQPAHEDFIMKITRDDLSDHELENITISGLRSDLNVYTNDKNRTIGIFKKEVLKNINSFDDAGQRLFALVVINNEVHVATTGKVYGVVSEANVELEEINSIEAAIKLSNVVIEEIIRQF